LTAENHLVFIPPSYRLLVVFTMGNISDFIFVYLLLLKMLEFYVNVTGEFHFNPFRIKIVYFLFPVIYNRLSILLAIAVGCLLANIGCANASYGGYGSGSYGTGARYGEICLSSDHTCKMGWNQNGRIRRRRWDVLPIILNDTAADVSVLLTSVTVNMTATMNLTNSRLIALKTNLFAATCPPVIIFPATWNYISKKQATNLLGCPCECLIIFLISFIRYDCESNGKFDALDFSVVLVS